MWRMLRPVWGSGTPLAGGLGDNPLYFSVQSPLLKSSAPQSEQEAPRLLGYEVKRLSLSLFHGL